MTKGYSRGGRGNRLGAIALTGSLWAALGGAALAATSIEEAARLAVRNHPTVDAARHERDAADASVGEAWSGYLPTLDARVGTGFQRIEDGTTRNRAGRSGHDDLLRTERQLSLRQMIFDGFATPAKLDAQRSRLRGADLKTTDTAGQIALRAVESYLEVLRRREVLELSRRSIDTHRALLNDVGLRAGGGRATGTDVAQARGRVANAQAILDLAEAAARSGEADYREAVGQSPDTLTPPGGSGLAIPDGLDDAVALALRQNPAVAAADAEEEARSSEITQARAGYYPRLDLEVSAAHDRDAGVADRTKDYRAMAVVRWNLYSGGADLARERRASGRQAAARSQADALRREITAAVQRDHAELQGQRRRLPSLRLHAETARRVVADYRQQFTLGQRSLLDVLNVEDERFQADVQHVNGRYAAIAAEYRLAWRVGQLLLGLGVSETASAP